MARVDTHTITALQRSFVRRFVLLIVDLTANFDVMESRSTVVMPALVGGIHVFAACVKPKTWMAGTSPAMTVAYARSALLEPHTGLIAVDEHDAGLF
jgi:hypothetical protein